LLAFTSANDIFGQISSPLRQNPSKRISKA